MSPSPTDSNLLERLEAAIADIQAGKMVILVDDEDRENEGDLVIAAELVTPEAISFMAKNGRGLICLALTGTQVDRLELPLMTLPGRRGPQLGTAFTVSIEARHGVSTGISAHDRAHTIQVAIAPDARPYDIVAPGHVFPLRARSGGVLVRAGQTEGSVDLARLAGLKPAGVICEIMNDDGTMARMPDLQRFSAEHGIRVVTIADLIAYRLKTERLVRRLCEMDIVLAQTHSVWHAVAYHGTVQDRQALALVKGSTDHADALLCRMHRGSVLADAFGVPHQGAGRSLRAAIAAIEQAGAGVIVYLPSLGDFRTELQALEETPNEKSSPVASPGPQAEGGLLREYGLGAQILRDLGLSRIRLLTNSPRRIYVGLQGYGLELVDTLPLA
jgi:3,4-dihydroxy 2-butanone 4-phosphate synthase / GTP cyclohydrolase II